MEVTVVISLSTTWVEDILNYDPLCDPQASDWEEKRPRCNGITEVMCDWCGDIAHKPEGLDEPGCERCDRCEVCENCIFNIGKESVCILCAAHDDETGKELSEAGKRRLSLFYRDGIKFEDIPKHRRR